MSRILDKFYNTTTYKQEFCAGQQLPWDYKKPDKSAGMKAVRSEAPSVQNNTIHRVCPCQPGGHMPPRGAKTRGMPTNLDTKCGCQSGNPCARPPPIKPEVKSAVTKKNVVIEAKNNPEKSSYHKKKIQFHYIEEEKPLCPPVKALRPLPRGKFGGQRCPQRNQQQGGGRNNGPPWLNERRDERRDPDVLRLNRQPPRGEIRDVIHGEGARRRNSERNEPPPRGRRVSQTRSDQRIPGPFWIRQRPDERREVDVPRRRKFDNTSEIRDVIHGEGPRAQRRQSFDSTLGCRRPSGSRTSMPFWLNKRPDERREPDIARKRKIERRGEVPDVIHGEERRNREWQERNRRRENRPPVDPYNLPPGPSHADPFWLLERQDERRDPDMDRKRKFGRQRIRAAEIIHGEDFRARWDPPKEEPEPGDDEGDSDEDDSEPFPFRRTCKCAPAGSRPLGLDDWNPKKGKLFEPEDRREKKTEARLSCAPEADVSNFDQPNTFMRKLYEKYPYLYQILKETPPEELISRVFKDRFLSTYQVDYLHLGVGSEDAAKGEGIQRHGEEQEPEIIPGCSYRHSQKGNFGRKKTVGKEKEKKETDESESEDYTNLSEYMRTISKLGGEIIKDKLYTREEIIKQAEHRLGF